MIGVAGGPAHVRPARDELVDAAALLILVAVAGVILQPTFGDWGYLVTMLVAALIGVAVAHAGRLLRLPGITVAALAVLAYLVCSGALALRSTAVAGVLPAASTWSTLARSTVSGWMDILTTVHPVGSAEPFLVVPYILGLAAGVAGFSLAVRTRSVAAPLVVPVALLSVTILFGSDRATLLPLTGSVFAVVLCGWAALRAARLRPARAGAPLRRRGLLAVGLLAVSGIAGWPLSSALPLSGNHARVVLSVDPPFDVSSLPSPLAGFRRYRPPPGAPSRTLFTVVGTPEGTPVRIATLDTYNGIVWGLGVDSQDVQGSPETFRQVGSTIPAQVDGAPVSADVTIGAGYSDVWLPDVGAVTSLTFDAGRSKAMRYNLATGTAIVPDRLAPGDHYRISAIVPPAPSQATMDNAQPALDTLSVSDEPAGLDTTARKWAGGARAGYDQVVAIAAYLRDNGAYSDGYDQGIQVLPGHGEGRMTDFFAGSQLVGDDEQYAAALALLGNSLRIPTRVVLGAFPEADGSVRASDVRAWDEVELEGLGWVAVQPTPDRNRHPNPNPPMEQLQQAEPQRVIPPVVPPALAPPDDQKATAARGIPPAPSATASIASGVLRAALEAGSVPLLLLLVAGALLLAKELRRRRRRAGGRGADRVAAGWVEVLDLACDMGLRVAPAATRREQARTLPARSAVELADAADTAVFGREQLAGSAVDAFWAQVMRVRREMTAPLTFPARARAALSTRSLRPRRSRPAGDRRRVR